MTDDTFVNAARAQSMLRDFDKLRKAIHSHDSELTEQIWDRYCERWTSCLNPNLEFKK